jgi:hypothetical protein
MLRLQASDCSTIRIMSDVSSTVVFCSESIECFPGMLSKFCLKHLVIFQWHQLLLVQSYISGSTFVVSLHINSSIIAYFPLPFAQHFCLQVLPHLPVACFIFFIFNCYIWPICCNFSVCIA